MTDLDWRKTVPSTEDQAALYSYIRGARKAFRSDNFYLVANTEEDGYSYWHSFIKGTNEIIVPTGKMRQAFWENRLINLLGMFI